MDVSRGGPSFALMCKEKESRVSSHPGDMPSVTEASGGFMAMHVANIAIVIVNSMNTSIVI